MYKTQEDTVKESTLSDYIKLQRHFNQFVYIIYSMNDSKKPIVNRFCNKPRLTLTSIQFSLALFQHEQVVI